jgi:hypothetical protein
MFHFSQERDPYFWLCFCPFEYCREMPVPSRLDQLLVKKAAHAIIQKQQNDATSKPSLFDEEGSVMMVQVCPMVLCNS